MAHDHKKGKYFKRFRDSIKFDTTKSVLQVLSSDASGNDGYNSYAFCLDEFHEQKDSKLWDVMCSSQGMRENSLGMIITTAGFNMFGFCYNYRSTCIEILKGVKDNDSQFAAIYTIDEDDDWTDNKVWQKANPSLGHTVFESYLQQQVQNAKNNTSLEVGIRTKNFNQWVQSKDIWINNDILLDSTQDIKLEDFNGCIAYVGVDLAAVSDLTAVSLMVIKDEKFYFFNKFYVPQSCLYNNSNCELYKEWKRKGMLTITNGNVCDYDYILSDLMKLNQIVMIEKIAYDSYNSTQWAISCTTEGLPLEPYSQALWHFNQSTKELERLFKLNKIVINNNDITRWCFSNVTLKFDHNDNCKPTKTSDMQKIDGTIAMIEALGIYMEQPSYNNKIFAI